MSEPAEVQYRSEGRIGFITLARPDKLNALSNEMYDALAGALREFDLDEDAWVGVLSGEGRAFCSGADVRSRQQRSPEELRREGGISGPYGRHIWDILLKSVNHKPIIAAVHGYALGAGFAAALSADIVVADETARFQVTEAQRGLSSIQFLAALQLRGLGASAIEACLTGRFIGAEEAAQRDLINRCVPEGTHRAAAVEIAESILRIPPLSVRASVRHRRHELLQVIDQAKYDAEPMRLHLSEDFRVSGQAFLDKNKAPEFNAR
jgi:enoyl-CoA hydratase/carnithine racemase